MARIIGKGGHRARIQLGLWRPDFIEGRRSTDTLPIHQRPVERVNPRFTVIPGAMTNGPAYDCDCD